MLGSASAVMVVTQQFTHYLTANQDTKRPPSLNEKNAGAVTRSLHNPTTLSCGIPLLRERDKASRVGTRQTVETYRMGFKA